MKALKIRSVLVALAACGTLTACSSLDRMGSKMDMVMGGNPSAGRLAYEGQLENARHVGSMMALQFKGGEYFDVSRAFGALYPGDIVRVYETPNGYEAHLRRSSQDAARQSAPPFGS